MGRVITNPTGSVVDASEVKILYESNENTNAYTDGDKASLGEVKDAIDMAKKVIEITFLLNNWTSNSDGTYSQTVNNSEIKSSMNPDLISMLSSDATPEEQKAYMKNYSILCQGVGNTANGSVTYKIYKQMTGDITVGLTRLGGVKQIESGGSVDDVKVGGVSVVKDKVAEIPEIPSTDNFIPYSGAAKDVNIGNHSLVVATTKQDVYPNKTDSYSLTANIGIGVLETPGTSIEVKKDEQYPDADSPYTEKTNMTISPGSFSVLNRRDTSDGIRTDMRIEATTNGFEVSSNDNAVLITDTAVKELADPVDGRDAANKKYVDESIAAIPEVDTSSLVPYTGATKDVNLGDHAVNFNTSGSVGDLSGSAIINVGKFAGGTGSVPGVYIEADAQSTDSSLSDNLMLRIDPTGISVDADHEGDTGGSNAVFRIGSDGLSIQSGLDTKVKITADKVTGLALPTADTDAASKKYVDDKIQRTYGYRKQLGLSDEIGSGKALTIAVELSRSSSKTGIAPDEILSFDVYANASATGMVSSIPTLDIKATTQYFTVNSKGIYTTTKWFVLTNNDPDEISYSANNAYVAIRTLYPDVTISIKKKALSS